MPMMKSRQRTTPFSAFATAWMVTASAGKIDRVHAGIESEARTCQEFKGCSSSTPMAIGLRVPTRSLPGSLTITTGHTSKYHRSHADRDVHLGAPIHSRSNNRQVITLSRRPDDSEGNFTGVISATILVDHMQAFYDTFDIGPSGIIRPDMETGTIIAEPSRR